MTYSNILGKRGRSWHICGDGASELESELSTDENRIVQTSLSSFLTLLLLCLHVLLLFAMFLVTTATELS